MATSGVVNGTDLRIYKGGTAIGRATTCSLSISRELREILDKDSTGSWTTSAPGRKSASLSTDAFFTYDTTNVKPETLWADLDNGTLITWRFTTDENGDKAWDGSGYVTEFSVNAGVEENSTYSVSITVSGAITLVTES
jgi:TP901-1 family phage major tail protein